MTRTQALPESRALDVDPAYIRAADAARAAGVTYRQLDTWIRNRWINTVGGDGSGYVRHLHTDEADVLTHMAHLVRRGVTPPQAEPVARDLAHHGTAHLGPYTLTTEQHRPTHNQHQETA